MLHSFEKCLLLLHRPRKQHSFPRLSLSGVGGGFGPIISEPSIWILGVSLIPMERMGRAKVRKGKAWRAGLLCFVLHKETVVEMLRKVK